VEATGLGHAVFGNVIATEPRDLYLAHVAALITVKALYELQRVQGRHALVTMCIGGGQGMAAVFERG
jgi:hypothetical protein